MPKTTIKIDSQILEPWRDIARIRGTSLNKYLKGYLAGFLQEMSDIDKIGEEISDRHYATREQAEAVAERFEAFAIERKLSGEADVGTVAAEVVPTDDGKWTVKAHYLSPAGKKWRSSSVIDEWNGLNDSDEEWKE
jgi:hypothetical protein